MWTLWFKRSQRFLGTVTLDVTISHAELGDLLAETGPIDPELEALIYVAM